MSDSPEAMGTGVFLGIVFAVAVLGFAALRAWTGLRILGRRAQVSIADSPQRKALPPAEELTSELLQATAALIRRLETARARLIAADHTRAKHNNRFVVSAMPLRGYADGVLEAVLAEVSAWLDVAGSDAAHLDETRDRLEDTFEYLSRFLAERSSQARQSPTMAQTLLTRIEGDLAAVESSFDELVRLEARGYR